MELRQQADLLEIRRQGEKKIYTSLHLSLSFLSFTCESMIKVFIFPHIINRIEGNLVEDLGWSQ